MSKLKEKSGFNIAAAELLKDESLYAPSIHCSYYSCFQLAKYTLKNIRSLSYEDISNTIKSSREKRSEHRYILECIVEELHNKKLNRKDIKEFKSDYDDLKHFRTKSDYHNIEIGIEESDKAITLSKKIITKLKNTF